MRFGYVLPNNWGPPDMADVVGLAVDADVVGLAVEAKAARPVAEWPGSVAVRSTRSSSTG